MNKRGQFSIIAALLVAVVLIATVVATYSTIRNSPIREQPQIQSAIDETNQAAKQILGFTVGYYGSVLMNTGNTTYAKALANNYLQSGLLYAASMHPDWGTSFSVTNSQLCTNWYTNTSYSSGNLTLGYNLTGLGIQGISYNASCSLMLQIRSTVNGEAYLTAIQDGSQPLVNLGRQNFAFYQYDTLKSLWNLANPATEPVAYSNGTYQIDIPAGVDVNSYVIQVEDQRGIVVVASSFSLYTINLAWNTTVLSSTQHFVDNVANVDGSGNVGTHSNFVAMQQGPDGVMDTLTEAITTPKAPETWVSPIAAENSGWQRRSNAYDGDTSTRAYFLMSPKSWSDNLTLDSSAISSHCIRYYIDADTRTQVSKIQIFIYNGSWASVYSGNGSWGAWTNVNFTEMSVTKMTISFYNNATASQNAYVYEAQFLRSATQQNCQLDLEVQWTNVDYTKPNQWLYIYGGTMATENILVDVWVNSAWQNLFNDLATGLNSVNVSRYLTSSSFTIRFKDGNATGDTVQDGWQIDTAYLISQTSGSLASSDAMVVELLQNGTMRWLGQSLQLTTKAKPILPVPVKSIHVNQTIGNLSSEVPFQVEDWASNYQIPLGLTSNASIFSSRTMLVFLVTPNVTMTTIWWNGSDTAIQTPLAYTNRYFNDNVATAVLSNGITSLSIGGGFTVTSTQGSSTAVATFMRINSQNSVYGAGAAYVIYNGVVRDIVQQEAEWSGGAPNSPNLYAQIVLTLPANVTYYTYQLRLMFINSQQNRTLTDLCPLSLACSTGTPETENGVTNSSPVTSNATGLFYDQSAATWAHHWSQFISGTTGAGIMFTDDANQKLYYFDSMAGSATGALSVTNTAQRTIELRPVTINPVSFTYAADVTWYGAVATFAGRTPIYCNSGGVITGLWILVELPPVVTVTSTS